MSDECGTTHYHGCACHEARRDAELRKAEQERDEWKTKATHWQPEEIEMAKAKAQQMVVTLDTERDELRARVAELERENKRLLPQGIHTCHADCQRVPCVLRRERDGLRDRMTRLTEALEKIAENDAAFGRPFAIARTALAGADDEKTREDDKCS